MNQTKTFIITICNKNHIPNDVQHLLFSFLFFRNIHERMIYTLKLAHFRRNENHPVLNSITNPHWYFYEHKKTAIHDLYIQARNCNKCGEYQQTQNVLYPLKLRCHCYFNF